MNKVIGIGGVPASGKTTLMVELMARFDDLTKVRLGKLKGYRSAKHNAYILGIYNGALFQGTDKLSMTAVTDLYKLCRVKSGITVIFEGDRFFSRKVFETLEASGTECTKFICQTEKQSERIIERGSEQSEQFLKAKATKTENLRDLENLTILDNNTPEQCRTNATLIFNQITK